MVSELNTKALSTPRHVALIPDGIRRWAWSHHVGLDGAYQRVTEVIEEIGTTLFGWGVETLSVYVLSRENLWRDPEDLRSTFEAHIRMFREVIPALANRWAARVTHVGDSTLLPPCYVDALVMAGRMTEDGHKPRRLYLCAGYSAEWEIATARSRWSNPDEMIKYLPIPHPIDMLIRTGGEIRTSGFLPLQLRYAEMFFLPNLFPDTSRIDIEHALQQFGRRQRRFGR